MKQKIFRIELILLFILSLISLIYSFSASHLPDNALTISSKSSDYYSGLYYISSLLASVAYYVGSWILLPFLAFSFVYNFILARRDKEGDLLVVFGLVGFFFFLIYSIWPEFLGEGLKILSMEFIDIYLAFFSVLIFGWITSYLVLRGSLIVLIKRFFKLQGLLGQFLISNVSKSAAHAKVFYLEHKKLLPQPALPSNLSTNLTLPKLKKSKDKEVVDQRVTITPRLSTEELKVKTTVDFSDEINQSSNEVSDDGQKEENIENVITEETKLNVAEAVTRRQTDTKDENKFFKSRDLIDCISANITHSQVKGPDDAYFNQIMKAIEEKLAEFRLDGKIINILKGPVVDTFELELGSGVKVSKVTGLSDDIGLALNGAPIRIVYPMRGRSTIGIEVPRSPRDFIFLDEVLQSEPFNDSKQRLPIAMGKDAFGDVKVVDLAGMPHMLVAGATGAGKSVFINSLLVSLIVKKSPRELKLILIDPKQLELALFADLPHLMLPVITDPSSSAVALLWAVEEMDKRYTILKEMGVKNIEGFNKKVKTCDQSILFKINEYYEDKEDPGYELPYIVVVIDEFADLILSKAGKEIELNVNRLAAKARAAGIHLVVATQRPSTDVVTGVVKANFPTRVAFRVSTGHDSKTILDQYGAEKLLGKGDMLYKHGVDLMRMHSSFVEENEVEGLIEKLATIPQTFNQEAIDFLENGGESLENDEAASAGSYTSGTSDDPVYQQALEVVMENGSASASMLQRRLRVGYNRAANLVEEMERNGIVGPAQGSKPRKVLARND